MGCVATLLSFLIVGGIVYGFWADNLDLAIGLGVALVVLWSIVGVVRSRVQPARGSVGDAETQALEPLPEWRRAIERRDYRRALAASGEMVSHARKFKRLEWDKATLAILLEVHIGTLHLAGESHEKQEAIRELMEILQLGQEDRVRARLIQISNADDETVIDGLLELSRRLSSERR